MYVVVYGPRWEDIMFFGDRTKAFRKLFVQMFGYDENWFMPQMYEWNLGDDGVYKRCKDSYVVNNERWSEFIAEGGSKCDIDIDRMMRLIEMV